MRNDGEIIKSFCLGVQGGRFFQKESPLAAGGKKNNFIAAILTFILFSIIFPQTAAAKNEKAVAWIVGGYKGCMVTRVENGIIKKYNAEFDMELYPGDRLYKKDDIKSVKFDFLSYAGLKGENKSGLIIVFNPPEKKGNIFKEIGKFLGLLKTRFKEIRGGTKDPGGIGVDSLENATFIADREIYFGCYLQGKTIIFKELDGKEVFRKTFGDNPALILVKAGLVQDKTYIWEIRRGETLHERMLIRVLSEKDEATVKKALQQIDSEKISADKKIVKKAAYLQFMSDLYPGQIDLYWLSYHLLKNSDLKEDEAKDVYDVLWNRCFNHFTGGITETDFALLDTPGCLVTIELEIEGEKRFVAPDFLFYEDDEFRIHFRTNFKGYAVILYEDEEKGEYQLVFPFENTGYDVKPNVNRHTIEYEFYEGPCKDKYIFILSKRPIKEMEKLQHLWGKQKQETIYQSHIEQKRLLDGLLKRAQKQGKELKVELMGTKAYVTTSEKDLVGITWFRLYLKNMGKK